MLLGRRLLLLFGRPLALGLSSGLDSFVRKSSLGGKDRLPIGPPQGLRPAPGTDKVAPYTEGGKDIE